MYNEISLFLGKRKELVILTKLLTLPVPVKCEC
nr:MAG TPA: hypothetical protein [Caudoviricetes sp.]